MPPLKSSSMMVPNTHDEQEEEGITSTSSSASTTAKDNENHTISTSTIIPVAVMPDSSSSSSSATATTATATSPTTRSTRGMSPTRKGTLRLRRRIRSRSAPAVYNRKNNHRRRLVEQHFKIDKESKALLPGVPVHDDDLARDLHDFFNLIILVPIVVLNVLNWDWEKLLFGGRNRGTNSMNGGMGGGDLGNHNNDLAEIPFSYAWTGEYYTLFFWSTVAYFIIDLAWVCIIPKCVKSPSTIVQHHLAVLFYLILPHFTPRARFLMGVCMSVELNTWFLIARRVFNKQGFSPWKLDIPYFVSVRVKLISILFYITWITIRCGIYPYLLYVMIFTIHRSKEYQDILHIIKIGAMMQFIFVCLNAKWSLDLLNSKIRQWKKGNGTKIESGL
mmetsp:Transcript_19183/g.24180  ORF Transcript_19183/g.24180 Transcript_19183/m.24180 type:complete len:389 (+) Transcript_19183:156-1322(+)